LGIGAIIGAGIFAAIGTAIAGDSGHVGAGSAIVVSIILAGITSAFAAITYSEFAALIPISGSAYTYAYSTLGELIAWIIGWDLILEYAVGNVAVAIGWAGYFDSLLRGFGITMPRWLVTDLRAALHDPALLAAAPHLGPIPIVFNFPAFAIVGVITWLLVIGTKESAWVNALMVALKLGVIGLFLVVGFVHIHPEQWTSPSFAPNGLKGISVGAASMILRVLEGEHMIDVDEKGGMKFYRINLLNPVAREFKVLFNVHRISRLVEPLKNYSDRIILFGSFADGTDGPESDVDLLVLTSEPQAAKDLFRVFQKKIVAHWKMSATLPSCPMGANASWFRCNKL